MTDIVTATTTTTVPTVVNAPATLLEPAMPEPGWKTSEFWFKLAAALLTALYASGVLTSNTALAIAGMAATVLGALGYTVSRSMVKAAISRAAIVVVNQPAVPVEPTFRAGRTSLE